MSLGVHEVPAKCIDCPSFGKSVFCGLDQEVLKDISVNKVSNIYKKGTVLIFEGNPNYGFFEICKGKVKISKLTSNGNDTIVDIATAGDTIGHSSLLNKKLYTTTATTVEDSVICFFDKSYFVNRILKEKEVFTKVIERLSDDVEKANQKISSLSNKNVRERLAELFLYLWDNYGTIDNEMRKLNILLSREEMASMIGVANETLIRTIGDFKDEGLVVQRGKYLYINNEIKLSEYANPNV